MKIFLSNLQKRFPARSDLLLTLAFTAFLVYGRMLFVYAWKLPSWLNYLALGEIFSILSYALVIALLESAGYVLFFALISALLPERWFRDGFVARSAWGVAIWIGSWWIYFTRLAGMGIEGGLTALSDLYLWLAVTVAMVIVAVAVSARIRWMRTAATWLADQSLIFLFLLIPAALIGLAVVIIRNLS